jgi:hypothetical protein
LNALGAKLLKAELLGNTDLAQKLKAELEEARSARQRHLVPTSITLALIVIGWLQN